MLHCGKQDHGVSSGQIIGRIERGATAIYSVLYDIFGQNLAPSFLVVGGVIITLLVKSPLMALVVFLPLPIYFLSVRKLTERIYSIERRSNERFEDISKHSYDVAGNVLTVKKFSQEFAERQNQKTLLSRARTIQYSAERLWSVLENIQTLISMVGRISVILLGGFFVLNGASTIGEFVLYITLQGMAYGPLARLSFIFPRLRRNSARIERMFELIDEEFDVTDKPDAIALPPFSKQIEFRNVWFKYGDIGRWAMKKLNVTIPAGTTVALVGRSGGGKTTFINLLLRSYDPTRGAILIDGHDLRDVVKESLLKQVAVVPQEVDLFSRTISENIAYGQKRPRKRDVENAARVALAHDFIMRTEKGYDTLVGERGIKLSGGERQRIGIARAVMRDPRILILDEATSHLDSESEQLISEATKALIKNRTTFIIAHRLSTVIHADIILVFKDGEIEAMGKHEELLRTNKTYQKLYSLQFKNV